jgi:hypothetical protein
MALLSEYESEYEELLRILVDRTPRQLRDYRRVDDIPGLTHEEASLVCKHNHCMAAEGLARVEDKAIELMSLIDHEDDRFGLLLASFATDALGAIRQRAAESLLPDIRGTAARMDEEAIDDAAFSRGWRD